MGAVTESVTEDPLWLKSCGRPLAQQAAVLGGRRRTPAQQAGLPACLIDRALLVRKIMIDTIGLTAPPPDRRRFRRRSRRPPDDDDLSH